MADLATPSAAAMGTSERAPTPASGKPKGQATKPDKPDEEQYKKDLAKAEEEHSAVQKRLNAIKAKLDIAQPRNKDSPTAKRQKELRDEQASIRQKQSGFKSSRAATFEKMKKLDEQLKSRQNEQKAARSKIPYKSVSEIDDRINRLKSEVDTGRMKLVDEKKNLAEITQLNKQRKSFAGFETTQKGIDDVKAQIAELKKTLDDPEAKALSDRYSEIQKGLDEIRAEQDEAFKGLNTLRDERTKLHNEQQEKYTALKDIKDKYYQAKRAYAEYEREAYRARKERQRAEHEAYLAGKRRAVANQKLEEASAPAYQDEVLTAEGLIRYFDPSSVAAKDTVTESKFAATAQRTVDDSGIKGTKLVRKDADEENYFMGTGGKKGKKGRKGAKAADSPAATPSEGKFNLSIGVIEELAKIKVDPPSSQAEVPGVVTQIREKLDHWKKDQDRKTKENIAKAQKEIDRLEAEANGAPVDDTGSKDTANKPSKANQGLEGKVSASAELAQERDAEADVAEDMKKASLEDKEDAAAEA